MSRTEPAARKRVRDRLVDAPDSLGAQSRARRWTLFAQVFPEIEDMHVLDLGGTVEAWRRAPVRPERVTVLNLLEPGESDDPWLRAIKGDACDPPPEVKTSKYDLVFSNSLIEHVGGHAKRLQLARVVQESAPRFWVQTPNRSFPIEPHFLVPFLQYLPLPLQAWLIQRWPLVHTRPQDYETAFRIVQWTELIGVRQLQSYFPLSQIITERVLGLPKSLIALDRGRPMSLAGP